MEQTSCPSKKKKCIRHRDCEECRKHHNESKKQRSVTCERNHKSLRQSTVIIESILLMVILQFVREFSERLLNPHFPRTVFAERMITMLIMIILSGAFGLYTRIRKTALSVFPKHFGKTYSIASCVSAILLISTPSNFTGGYQAIMPLHGSWQQGSDMGRCLGLFA